MKLHVGDHIVPDAEAAIERYLSPGWVRNGPLYYRHRPCTDPDRVVLEDLGAAVLLEGVRSSRAARSLADRPVYIGRVPKIPLEEAEESDRQLVVDAIMDLIGPTRGSGFASSVATKVLHKKRPATVPVLDNRAVYGAFLDASWSPGEWPAGHSVRAAGRVRAALDAVAQVLSDHRNEATWETVCMRWNEFTRVELFDMAWWAYVRTTASR